MGGRPRPSARPAPSPAKRWREQRTMSDERIKELDVLAQLVQERKIDRRRLIQAAAALGLTSTAAGAVAFDSRSAAAQGAATGIVTVSQEQQQTWTKNFNPFLNEGQSRWPTQAGIYEPM